MCWVAVDRAIVLSGRFLDREPTTWIELREAMAAEVLEQGWNPTVGSFTAAFGSADLDASALVVGLSGLVAPDDERFRATVSAVEHRLRSGPTVHRYRRDDGLPGREGGHHLATSWLIDALLPSGSPPGRGRPVRRAGRDLVGPTGLLPELHDPETGRSLGNLPQLHAHAGLIANALALDGNL